MGWKKHEALAVLARARQRSLLQGRGMDAVLDQRLARIEGKLDKLIEALAEDEEPPATTLDGTSLPERDQTQGLG